MKEKTWRRMTILALVMAVMIYWLSGLVGAKPMQMSLQPTPYWIVSGDGVNMAEILSAQEYATNNWTLKVKFSIAETLANAKAIPLRKFTESNDVRKYDNTFTTSITLENPMEYGIREFNVTSNDTIEWGENSTILILTYTYDQADVSYHDDSGASSNQGFQMKWNITTIPAGSTVTDAELCLFIYNKYGSPDNDVQLWRINNRTWMEGIAGSHAIVLPVTNNQNTTMTSTTNNTWTCINVTTQFLVDYNATNPNQNFSIRLEDRDAQVPWNSAIYDWVMGDNTGLGMGINDNNVAFLFEDRENSKNTNKRPTLNITYDSAASGNSSPTKSSFKVNSTEATNITNGSIQCWSNWTDNDASFSIQYEWYKDSANQTALAGKKSANNATETLINTVAYGNISKGQNWTCRIRGNDGANQSSWYNGSLLVANSLPVGSVPTLNSTTPQNYSNESLWCWNGSSYDLDGDTVFWAYKWFNNSISEAGLANRTQVLAGNLTAGQSWVCEATPYSVGAAGTPLNSSVLTIAATLTMPALYQSLLVFLDTLTGITQITYPIIANFRNDINIGGSGDLNLGVWEAFPHFSRAVYFQTIAGGASLMAHDNNLMMLGGYAMETKHVFPYLNSTYDLGNTSNPWRSLTTGNITDVSLQGTYTGGQASVCVYDNGTLFASDAGC
jgi:hypothetical protein